MPERIVLEDIFNDMLDSINSIRLSTYIKLGEK